MPNPSLRATREIKRLCPGCKISGGVSNIAFSFRGNEPVRRAFHSAFLHHACAVGFHLRLVDLQSCPQMNPCCGPFCFWDPMRLSLSLPWRGVLTHTHSCAQAGMDMGIVNALQVKADVYEKIDKELLDFVEDVLLNRCENATERMLEYAATLDPKSKPTDVKRKGAQGHCLTNLTGLGVGEVQARSCPALGKDGAFASFWDADRR